MFDKKVPSSSWPVSDERPLPMQKIFESQPGMIMILSPDLIIEAVTDAYLQETQLVREKVIGKNVFHVFPQNPDIPEADSTAKLKASLDFVLSNRKKHHIEAIHYDLPCEKEPGKFLERYWETTNSPVLNQQGEVLYVIHETKNITDWIKAQRQVRESRSREKKALGEAEQQRARLERFFRQAPAQICIFEGPDFVFEFVNPSFQEGLFPGRKLLDRPLKEAIPEVADQPIAEVLRQVYQTGETIEGKEVCIWLAPHEGGPLKAHYFNYIQQARFDGQGRVDGIMSFAYDVTELVNSRKKLQAVNADLEERISARTKDLQLAQAESERQKERMHALLMQAPIAICILKGPALVYELVNPAYRALFPGRKLQGRPVSEAIPELLSSSALEQLQEVYRTGEAFEAQEVLIPVARQKDGQLENVYFDYILQPQRNELGEMEGVLVFAYDITQQVMERRKVEQNEEILQFALKAGKMATFDLDLITNKTTRSANHDQLFGYETNLPEWNMEALLAHMLPEDHAPVLRQFQESLETGELWLTPRIRQQNGQLRYIEGYGKVIYEKAKKGSARGKPLRIAGVVRDVTERRLNQQQEERLAAIVENSSDFIALSTLDGMGIFINQAGKEMLGLAADQSPASLHIADFFFPEDHDFLEEVILPAVGKNGSWKGEIRFRHFQSGNPIPVYYTIFSIKDPESGEMLGLAIITSNISDLKKKEVQLHSLSQELAEANRELVDANEAVREKNTDLEKINQQLTHTNSDLDNFIYAASHDLKAPITNIEGLIRLMRMKLPKEVLEQHQMEQIFKMMQDSIARFQRTIDHLTDITKLQKDNDKEVSPVSLSHVVQDVILDLDLLIKKEGAILEVNIDGCPSVPFSEKNMRSIVYNLISNAIKFRSPERKPVVKISCKQENEFLVLKVSDNGLGVNPQNEKKLFAMFKRFHSHVEGSGIGLYMVKKIIENAGGKIEVRSRQGEGTTFRVYFYR